MGRRLRNLAWLTGAFGVAVALSACDTSGNDSLTGGPAETPVEAPGVGNADPATSNNPSGGGGTPGLATGQNGADPGAAQNPNIDERTLDYGEALRTASLKLLGDLPTLAQINQLAAATEANQKALYEGAIDLMLADPRFAARMIQFWRDSLKTGGGGDGQGGPSFDTAATFVAEVIVQDRSYTDVFTASSGTCPTFSNGQFQSADCQNNAPTTGILTDPGLMAQYYANLAFRRTRFVQETFACSKFPAEFSTTTKLMGAGTYTSPWDFNSITGGTGAKINFQDTSAVICANCHTSLNHIAPLFGHFDEQGQYDGTKFSVNVPVPGTPAATLQDWLPEGQPFAWRNGKTVADLPGLGQAIAADPDVATCLVNRYWNFAMSRGDIVNDLATVPPVVTSPYVADFTSHGMRVKRIIRSIFTSDDFVRF